MYVTSYTCFKDDPEQMLEGKFLDEVLEKLDKAHCDAQKLFKAASITYDKVEEAEPDSVRAKDLMKQTSEQLEVVDGMAENIRYMMKFKKDKTTKKPLTLKLAQKTLEELALQTMELITLNKSLKVFL